MEVERHDLGQAHLGDRECSEVVPIEAIDAILGRSSYCSHVTANRSVVGARFVRSTA